jgi:hypothetical protein
VPVPKPGTHHPAVCKPDAIRRQLQLVLAMQVGQVGQQGPARSMSLATCVTVNMTLLLLWTN